MSALGVLYTVVCLTMLASFFLPSAPLIMTCITVLNSDQF